jgi:very-short-patch-repair endonuclease
MSSHLELLLEEQMKDAGLPQPDKEVIFHPTRRWRFDFAFPDKMLAVEVEGGQWGGRHTSGKGFEQDAIKYAEAMLLGWRVLRIPGSMISKSLIGVEYIKKIYDSL